MTQPDPWGVAGQNAARRIQGNVNYGKINMSGMTTNTFATHTITPVNINPYGPQHWPCAVCSTPINMKPSVDNLFIGGFWFCDNNCRLEFIFRQLVRTDQIG